jgi:hypothetical protein
LSWLAVDQWFSPGALVSSTNKTARPPRYNWYIVKSGVKHHYPNPSATIIKDKSINHILVSTLKNFHHGNGSTHHCNRMTDGKNHRNKPDAWFLTIADFPSSFDICSYFEKDTCNSHLRYRIVLQTNFWGKYSKSKRSNFRNDMQISIW